MSTSISPVEPVFNDEGEIPSEPPRHVIKQELAAEEKLKMKDLHQQSGSAVLRQQLNNVAIIFLIWACITLYYQQMWIGLVIGWLALGHFFHTKPLSLHDASHGTLDQNRRRNTIFGIVCGTGSLVPLSVYRYAHAYHHGFMATKADPELWPFNDPQASRPFRMLCAFLEIFFGFIYTPLLFVRSLFVCGKLKKDLRKRIIFEYCLILLVWGTLFTVVAWQGWWVQFLVGFGVPYAFAGMYQTLNKYTEHMGLLGDTVLSGTRTVIPKKRVDKTISNMMQHVDHHGTHHRYARIPFYALPEASEVVYGENNPENPVYSTYAGAFFAMLPTLWNPKVGSQWKQDASA
ncbi:fatty acid desaturase [uncultured Rubinisphaera sp.]|uniref:fatty acid desaturase family protein n=1 Tax=uncultured Rubinisphaera sp. TaxID=1678686 RepID=UPI000EBE656E|nr:hypothetical protein [Planctomycetaceae bacterium]|tara:strand:- start:366 stop:1403 length:1038 start_codon:yes stop_codon:yes gene_type:complete